MYIVYIEDDRHSAWDTKKGALHQMHTLEDAGYKDVWIEYDCTVQVSNGHYYI